MIGLGIVTYRRPRYFADLCASVAEHLRFSVDGVWVHNDGTDADHIDGYGEARMPLVKAFDRHSASFGPNRGVGYAKNQVLQKMMDAGCDWLFVAEDDVVVKSPEAVLGYIEACKKSGYGHLSFHAHGNGNRTPIGGKSGVTLWPAVVGAWCVYSREAIETCGLMDADMVNAFEHVEHTLRLAKAGFTHQWPGCADATGSEDWLQEQPDAIANTSIPLEGRDERMEHSKKLWRERNPDTYKLLWAL